MKRKMIALLLAVSVCLSLAVTVSAVQIPFVQNDLGIIEYSDSARLNEKASLIWEDTGVAVFYVYTVAPDLTEYDYSVHTGDFTDYYIMLENENSWYNFAGGRGELLDSDTLRLRYDNEKTYAHGVEAYLSEAMTQLTLDPKETQISAPADKSLLVWDEAQLLTEAEKAVLDAKLERLGNTYSAELRVVTVSAVENGDVDEYVELVYDRFNFGYGKNRDGVLLLVCMDPREYRVLSNGYAGDAISTGDISSMGSMFKSDLSDGNYAEAFDTFANRCEYYLNGYINGFPFNTVLNLVVALAIGFVIALIVTSVWKRQLRSVYMQHQANVYLKGGSMQITHSAEHFLYSSITKTMRDDDSDDDDSGFSSSSGGSRSIGGGSF